MGGAGSNVDLQNRSWNWRSKYLPFLYLLTIFAVWIILPIAFPDPAGAETEPPIEVSAAAAEKYGEEADLSLEEAEDSLALQAEGAPVVEALEADEQLEFAGIWFDSEAGEFVIPRVAETPVSEVAEVVSDSGLEPPDYRSELVGATYEDLERAQRELTDRFDSLGFKNLYLSYIDPRVNSVIVELASGSSPAQESTARREVADASAPARLELREEHALRVGNLLCRPLSAFRICSQPLRAGVGIGPQGQSTCTAAFKATGLQFGNRFLLTAGHCVHFNNWWGSPAALSPTSAEVKEIGWVEQMQTAPRDFAKIKANGSYWDTPSWPSWVAWWGSNEEYPIQAEAASYVGQWVCRSGLMTVACDEVVALDLTASNVGREHLTMIGNTCGEHGDSGGPIFTQTNIALGIVSARVEPAPPCGQMRVLYTEITEATDEMGVTVGPRLGSPPFAYTGEPACCAQPYQALLHGQVAPHGLPTDFHFKFGETEAMERNTYSNTAGAGWGPIPVAAWAENLRGRTKYFLALEANNSAGAHESYDEEFTTPPWPPRITNVQAIPGPGQATFRARIDGQREATTYRLTYHGADQYASHIPFTSVPKPDLQIGGEPQDVEQVVGNLEGTIEYSFVATNGTGETAAPGGGNWNSVWVQPRPRIDMDQASELTATSARLEGKIDPAKSPTTYYFEWGTSESYGNKSPASSIQPSGNQRVSLPLSNLEFGRTYHYRIVATNAAGTRVGEDRTVTPGWSLLQPPKKPLMFQEELPANFTGISCSGSTDCLAIGSEAPPLGDWPVAERWNGSQWTLLTRPANLAGSTNTLLRGVDCVNLNFCMVVGDAVNHTAAYAARRTGVAWEPQGVLSPSSPEAGDSAHLFAVSCVSETFCMAAGRYGSSYSQHSPLIGRWDGTSWKAEALPQPSGPARLTGISCSSAISCVAIGEGPDDPIVYRWSGSGWSTEGLPKPLDFKAGSFGSSIYPKAVSCFSSTSCLVGGGYRGLIKAGEYGTKPYAASWNGTAWSVRTVQHQPLSGTISSIACGGALRCQAVGFWETQGEFEKPFAVGFDGSQGKATQIPVPPYVSGGEEVQYGILNGVSCVTDRACVAIGAFRGLNAIGGNPMALGFFRTPPPTSITEQQIAVTETGATLKGAVTAHGSPTKYRFEYGRTTAYGSTTTELVAGEGFQPVSVSRAISGLEPGVKYNYRIIATNAEGTTTGQNQQFETNPNSTKIRLSAMALTDPFDGTASATSSFNGTSQYPTNWTRLPWAAVKGTVTANGFSGSGGASVGAYFAPTAVSAGRGIAVQAVLAASPKTWDSSMKLWLDLPAQASTGTSTQSGYALEAAVKRNQPNPDLYNVKLVKYQAGVRAWETWKEEVSIAPGAKLALVDEGSKVSVWMDTGSGFVQLLTRKDETLEGGRAAVEASTYSQGRWAKFRFGAL